MSLTLYSQNPSTDFMELKSQTTTVSDASLFLSSPGSPDLLSPTGMQFYSAPGSPMADRSTPDDQEDKDDFKFETSLSFNCVEEQQNQRLRAEAAAAEEEKKPRRGDSLPAMAFADELFCNGRVLPLKLPPRLQQQQQQQQQQGQRSVPTSPRSPVLRVSGRRATWNDDFDPFAVALQKVSSSSSSEEEQMMIKKRGRTINDESCNHRRTRSHSPFRSMTYGSHSSYEHNNNHVHHEQRMGSNTKEASFAEKVVRKESIVMEPKGEEEGAKRKRVRFGGKGRAVVGEQGGPMGSEGSGGDEKGVIIRDHHQSTKGIKGILMRFASIGKEKSVDKSVGSGGGYFKRLSFRFKGGTGEGNGRELGKGEGVARGDQSKMALVQYRAKLPLCLGYGIRSP